MKFDKRVMLYLVLLGVFVAWLGAILFLLMPHALSNLENIDPVLTLLTGLGIGGITQFFILLLKDGWTFYFRKKPEGE